MLLHVENALNYCFECPENQNSKKIMNRCLIGKKKYRVKYLKIMIFFTKYK